MRVPGLCFHGFPKGSPSEKAADQLQELRRPPPFGERSERTTTENKENDDDDRER